MAYISQAILAVNPLTSPLEIARNVTGQIYLESDTSYSSPITVELLDGTPLSTINTTDLGFIPPLRLPEGIVVWVSGPYIVPIVTVRGAIELAQDAATSAAEAAAAASAAVSWGSISGKPAVVAAGIDAEAARDAIGASALSENVRNILRYGVQRGTAASQTAAITAALNSAPGEAFMFPPGSYRLDATLNVTANNTLIFAPGARLYAGAAMETLVNYDNGEPSAVSNFTADKGIIGNGILDGNLLANNALVVASVLRFPIEGLTIVNPLRRGIWTRTPGAEIFARNIRIYNTGTTNSHTTVTVSTTSGSASIVATSGTFSAADVGFPIIAAGVRVGTVIQAVADSTHATLSTNASATASVSATIITSVGIDANMGDCHWDDSVVRDFTIGVWDKGSGLWSRTHPWIGNTAQLTARYRHSVAFWVGAESQLVLPYADTYRYSYRMASTGGFAKVQLSMPRVYANTGSLTNELAASYPGVVFDMQDPSARANSMGGSWRGHSVTPHAFVAGTTKSFVARDSQDLGGVSGVGNYYRGVRLGVSAFSATLFGVGGGSVTLTTNNCRMEVREGFVRYVFILAGTATGDLAGALRVGGLPLPPGASSTSNGTGTVSWTSGPDVNATIGGGGGAAPLEVQLVKMSGGTTTQPSATALAGQAVQVWGEITCPFSYPT